MAFSSFITIAYTAVTGALEWFSDIVDALPDFFEFFLFVFVVGLVFRFIINPLFGSARSETASEARSTIRSKIAGEKKK